MTENAAKTKSELRLKPKQLAHGERKTVEELMRTTWWLKPYGLAIYCDSPAADVEKQKQSRITRITTSLLMLCGCVNHATNKGIKS